jgi:hypothetical protein
MADDLAADPNFEIVIGALVAAHIKSWRVGSCLKKLIARKCELLKDNKHESTCVLQTYRVCRLLASRLKIVYTLGIHNTYTRGIEVYTPGIQTILRVSKTYPGYKNHTHATQTTLSTPGT